MTTLAQKANALVEGWYLGQEGGHAVADVLFGRIDPGGKLSVSFPPSAGELPAWYDRHPSASLYPFVEGKREALFPFGFGLSYTTFELSAPRLSSSEITPAGKIQVEVDVANTGNRDGDEVVQLYIRDDKSSAPRPLQELKGFCRVSVKAGARTTVRFALGPDELGFWDAEMKWSVAPGTFRISTGNSAVALQHAQLLVAEN